MINFGVKAQIADNWLTGR